MHQLNNLKTIVPDSMYNIDEYNKISFQILESLRNSFNQVNHLLSNNRINKYYNLVGIFYHHLNCLLCSYYFFKYEKYILRYDHRKHELFFNNTSSNHHSLINDNYESSIINIYKKNSFKFIFISIISKLIGSLSSKNQIMIAPNSAGLNLFKFLRKSYPIEKWISDFQFKYKLGDEQWGIIESQLNNLDVTLMNRYTNDLGISKNSMNYIKSEFFKYHNNIKEIKIKSNFIITGSMADIHTRIISSHAKAQNKQVISLWHGESIGTMDEPIFNEVELCYSDYIIGYGDFGCKKLNNMKKTEVILNKTRKIIPRSSNKIKKIYSGKKINKIVKSNIQSMMYVPTSYTGLVRYGPYRDINDLVYMYWQDSLLCEIKKQFNPSELIKKIHRKQNISQKNIINNIVTYKSIDLIELIDKTDIFIFDYPTSAFAIAVATQKPIIYFDIGLRNIEQGALAEIKKRCIYVKGNLKNVDQLVLNALKQHNKECTNMYTEKYSISKSDNELHDILFNIIN